MKQSRIPLWEALVRHYNHRSLSLHVPGHKGGEVFFPQAKAFFKNLLPIDLTELPGLDDLHAPTGVIRQAQALLARFYHADHSWFLVGGSTAGNLAMVLTACKKDDKILIQRNSHHSVWNGVKLAGARPVCLSPRIDRASGLGTVPSLDTVKKGFSRHPGVKALLLTNPNYYGMTADLQPLIEWAHAQGMAVLVDEAHGAHFVLGEPFPKSALESGADVVVQSAHKTLPAMTMGAFLHVQGERIHQKRLGEVLAMLQSSSPSYPIMASLDLARRYMAQLEKNDITTITQDLVHIREQLGYFSQFSLLAPKANSDTKIDPLKVVLQTGSHVSGFTLADRFIREGVMPEMADLYHVLFIFPLVRFREKDRLLQAVTRAVSGLKKMEATSPDDFPEMPVVSCPVQITKQNPTKVVPLQHAEGKISAQEVTPYPPGVPLVIRGEKVTASQMDAIQRWHAAGGRFQSGADLFTKGIEVAADECI